MVTQSGGIKLLDFGLAKLIESTSRVLFRPRANQTAVPLQLLSEQGTIVGTIPYLSPEQAEGVPA